MSWARGGGSEGGMGKCSLQKLNFGDFYHISVGGGVRSKSRRISFYQGSTVTKEYIGGLVGLLLQNVRLFRAFQNVLTDYYFETFWN